MPSSSSSSFDAATTTTAKDMAPADAAETRAKDGFKEEVADGIMGPDGLFDAQRMEEVEILLLLIKIPQQILITAIDK